MSKLFAGLTRSELMARIRSRGNRTTELALAKLFRRHKISGWRRQILIRTTTDRSVRVRPDFVFPRFKLAVFVDGCFWHGCRRCYRAPKSNRAFWREKIDGNRRRDARVNRALRRAGWRVARLRECDLQRHPQGCADRLRRLLRRERRI